LQLQFICFILFSANDAFSCVIFGARNFISDVLWNEKNGARNLSQMTGDVLKLWYNYNAMRFVTVMSMFAKKMP